MSVEVKGEAKRPTGFGLGLEAYSADAETVKAKDAGAPSAPVKTIQIGKDIIETPKDAAPTEDSSCCFSYLCCIPQAIVSAICSVWRWVFGSGSAKVETKPGDTASNDPRIITETREVLSSNGKVTEPVKTLSNETLRAALKSKDRELIFKCTTISAHELFTAKEYDLLVELIMKGKCSVNQTDKEGNTILQLLCNMGDECLNIKAGPDGKKKDLFAWLLAQGADADIVDKADKNPLQIACAKGAFGCVRLLAPHTTHLNVRDQNGATVAHLVAAAGNSATFDALVANVVRKPSFNLFNNAHQTLLHVICRTVPGTSGHLSILKLICADAKLTVIDEKDKEGNTALHYACRFGNVEAIKVLLKAGARTDLQDNDGNTALLLVAQNPMDLDAQLQVGMAQVLMANERTDVRAKSSSGYGVIHYIAQKGASDLLGAIVEAKPGVDLDVNERVGDMGVTALHIAVSSKQATMTTSLIRYLNADKNAQDKAGRTAEGYATGLEGDGSVRQHIIDTLKNEVYMAPEAPLPPAEEVALAAEPSNEGSLFADGTALSEDDAKEAEASEAATAEVDTLIIEQPPAPVAETPVTVAQPATEQAPAAPEAPANTGATGL